MGSRARQGTVQQPVFVDECRSAFQALRGALIESFESLGLDPSRPRDSARHLELDKNLAWKVSKIAGQPDVFQAVSHVPGRAGIGILCKALEHAGARSVEQVRQTAAAFDRMVERHAGDRATLELVAGNFIPVEGRRESLESARKLAFRGNSAVWSVQARLQLGVTLMAPNGDDPTMVDLAQVFGLVDLRRLRPDVRWLLGRRQVWDDAATVVRGVGGEPLDPDVPATGFPLLREFSSAEFPDIHVADMGDELQYRLPEGPVGRTSELTCLWGSKFAALGSQYGDANNRYSQLGVNLMTPVEHLQFDALVHEDLSWAMHPTIAVYGRMDGRMVKVGERGAHPFPIESTVVELGHGLTAVATSHMRRYTELVEWVFARVGWDPTRFRVFRFELPYPPIPSHAILYSELAPAEDRP